MGAAISHDIDIAQRNFRVPRGKFRIDQINVLRCFSHDLDIAYHCILHLRIGGKISFGQTGCVAGNSRDGLEDMVHELCHAGRIRPHTGRASEMTLPLYDSGRERGVRTSTEIPRSCSRRP